MTQDNVVVCYKIEKNITNISICGEISADNDYKFKIKLEEILNKTEFPKFIVDMAECSYINSKGIGILAMILKNVKKLDGDIVFYNLQPPLMRLFEVTRLIDVFVIKKSHDEAMSFYN